MPQPSKGEHRRPLSSKAPCLGSLDLLAQWHGWQSDQRPSRRDYGIYAFTPAFDEGTRIRLDRVHAALAHSHRFSATTSLPRGASLPTQRPRQVSMDGGCIRLKENMRGRKTAKGRSRYCADSLPAGLALDPFVTVEHKLDPERRMSVRCQLS